MWSLVAPLALLATSANAQVTASNPNGPTNPDKPEFYPIGAQVNQTSMSRLLTLNSVDDFCLYGPPEPGPDSVIGNVEPVVVAYCTKPRNNARLIPDGTIHSAHFIKTPLYVQIYGLWDGTRVNIPANDDGGELDPHGPKNEGNPIGGNVTSDVSGEDVFYEEWMSFISTNQYCLRICTAETANVTTALQCEHELDIMGCKFVMATPPLESTNGSFTSCEGEPAAPPGLYPMSSGGYSTFRQRYTGTYTDENKKAVVYTVGLTVTPTAVAFIPKTSECTTYSTISNGIDVSNLMVTAAPVLLKGNGSVSTVANIGTTSMASVTSVTDMVRPTAAPSNNNQTTGTDAAAQGNVDKTASSSMTTDSQGNTVAAPATTSSNGSGAAGLVPATALALMGVVAGALAVF